MPLCEKLLDKVYKFRIGCTGSNAAKSNNATSHKKFFEPKVLLSRIVEHFFVWPRDNRNPFATQIALAKLEENCQTWALVFGAALGPLVNTASLVRAPKPPTTFLDLVAEDHAVASNLPNLTSTTPMTTGMAGMVRARQELQNMKN